MTYDVIVSGGLWFDGTGRTPQLRNLGIRDGVVATVSAQPLDETGCPDVIDAKGKWVTPGFIDVHTHYDAEVLLDPGLRESVRHGVTTVLLGMCSLSTVYAENDINFYRGRGCEHCKTTGYRGRSGIHEILTITDRVRGMILNNASSAELRQAAMEDGMRTMQHDAIQKVLMGATSLEECLRVIAVEGSE